MKNITHHVEGSTLVLRIDVSPATLAGATPSTSGKTKIVATTSGNQAIALPGGAVLSLGVNAYIK